MRILFLDFDGPLHPNAVYRIRGKGVQLNLSEIPSEFRRYDLFCYAPILAAVLADYTEVQIVLSTSWVQQLGFNVAKARLPAELQSRVIGATWHSAMRREDPLWWQCLSRYQQIAAYVTRHDVKDWLAIDDDAGGWSFEQRHRLVLTDPLRGLGDPVVQADLRNRLTVLRGSGV